MTTNKMHLNRIPMPLLAIVGPLMGLIYVLVLPFTGLVTLIVVSGCRAKQVFAAVWHRAADATVDYR